MTRWTLAPCLQVLRSELDQWRPNRDRSSDGAIGDAAHAATWSDHNPNTAGVVCAYDIDVDLDGTNDNNGGVDVAELVEALRTRPHPDVKYVIFSRGMFSRYPAHGVPPFTWRLYTGPDPHTSHVHVSVGVGLDGRSAPGTYDDLEPWAIVPTQPPAPPALLAKEKHMEPILDADGTLWVFAIGTDSAVWERHCPRGGAWTDWATLGGVVRTPS